MVVKKTLTRMVLARSVSHANTITVHKVVMIVLIVAINMIRQFGGCKILNDDVF